MILFSVGHATMRRREPPSTTTIGICGTFQLHNSTPMHTHPHAPELGRCLSTMSAILEVKVRSPYHVALVPTISPGHPAEMSSLVLAYRGVTHTSTSMYAMAFRTKDTPIPTTSPSREGVRPAGCTSPTGSQVVSAAHA